MNPRGGDSPGVVFATAGRIPCGRPVRSRILEVSDAPRHDYDDLMAGVDSLVARGYIDDRNLFVYGGS